MTEDGSEILLLWVVPGVALGLVSLLPNPPAYMIKGEGQLTITVVPESGAGELAGISGKLMIKIDGGKHSYDFEYTLK